MGGKWQWNGTDRRKAEKEGEKKRKDDEPESKRVTIKVREKIVF